MKQFAFALLGTVVGSVVVGSLGIALVSLLALGGTVAWVVLDNPEPESISVVQSPPNQRSTKRAPTALAEICVQTQANVAMNMDGAPMEYDAAAMCFRGSTGSGEHMLQVYNLWGKEVARHSLSASAGRQTLLKYHNPDRAFTKVSVTAVPPKRAAPAPAPIIAAAPPAPLPMVQAAALPPPAPRHSGGLLGMIKGIGGESSSRRSSSSSSRRYGEVSSSAPGHSEVHGYDDQNNTEAEDTKKRRFRF